MNAFINIRDWKQIMKTRQKRFKVTSFCSKTFRIVKETKVLIAGLIVKLSIHVWDMKQGTKTAENKRLKTERLSCKTIWVTGELEEVMGVSCVSLQWVCSEFAVSLQWVCSEFAGSLQWVCSEFAVNL